MAHQVVRLAHELFTGESAHRHERWVAANDAALEVGHGDPGLLGQKGKLALRDWLIVAPGKPLK
jgi:hypothetical protein